MIPRFLACGAAAAVALSVALVGCNTEAPTGSVSGSVKLDGNPLVSGIVTFVGPDGKVKTAGPVKDGKYKVERIPLGKCKVSVTWSVPAGDASDPTKKVDTTPVAIPDKYSEAKTELTVDVKSGSNTDFDIVMTK